jgi:hypothetical protein
MRQEARLTNRVKGRRKKNYAKILNSQSKRF